MRSSPAVAAFNDDVSSYISCVWCRAGQKCKACFSNDLLQRRRGKGEAGCLGLGLPGVVSAGANPECIGL